MFTSCSDMLKAYFLHPMQMKFPGFSFGSKVTERANSKLILLLLPRAYENKKKHKRYQTLGGEMLKTSRETGAM